MNRTTNSSIVAEWLRSLHLAQYADSFIDNGYDDLEICKQVGDPDLDAIGVFNPVHRSVLLQSVRNLREEGAAAVYFTLEEKTTLHDECVCDSASIRSHKTAVQWDLERFGTYCLPASPATSLGNRDQDTSALYYDDYEECKIELVKIPRVQLKILLREKLDQDGIRLSCQPYSNKAILIDSPLLQEALPCRQMRLVFFNAISKFGVGHHQCGMFHMLKDTETSETFSSGPRRK